MSGLSSAQVRRSGCGGGSPSGFRNRTQAGSSQTAGFGSDGMTDVVITAARRTPVGSFLGSFATTPAHELGRIAIEAALGDAGVAPDEVSEVILGQVLTAAQGQNPARQAAIHRSEEQTSELQSLMRNSYTAFCVNTQIAQK